MMKWLLLLLASGLATSDKLDRTYLPPPGANYSGGTLDDLHPPLEVPKESYTGAIQNGSYYDGISTVPNDYIITNGLRQTTKNPANAYQLPVQISKPAQSFYSNFPPKAPSSGYLPSKQPPAATQFYPAPNFSPGFETISTINKIRPGFDQKDNKNYYYVPTMPIYKNGITNQRPIDGTPIAGLIQFPNQVNNGYIFGNGQSYIPTTTSSNNIVQNYQPNAFGYYGGNPMIMTSQSPSPKEIENMGLTPKFGGNENDLPASVNQEKIKENKKTLVRPFQTPLVRPNPNNTLKPTYPKATTTTLPSLFPTAGTKSFPSKNVPTALDQRNEIPVRPRFRQERPQAESDRNALIVNYDNNISPEGFSYSYDTSNGIHADESGTATNGVRAKGSYSYTGDDGKIYTVTYTADENGFQPRGDHIPTAPPIPEAIQNVIDQAAKNKMAGIIEDGSYDDSKYGYMNYLGAMDRYNLFKKNNGKVPRIDGAEGKQSASLPNKSKNLFNNIPLHNNSDSKANEQATGRLNNLQNTNNNDTTKVYTPDNKLNRKKGFIAGTRSNFYNQNKEQLKNENIKPINLETGNQITSEEVVMFQTQTPNDEYRPTNTNADNTYNQNQISQKNTPDANSVVTFTDDGYYYVPPIIKFNPNTEETAFKDNSYLITSEPNSNTIDTEANKRNGFDEPLKRKNIYEESSSTQQPFNLNTVATEPTRQPYISGPDDRDKTSYDNVQSNIFDQSNKNKDVSYPNDQNLPSYAFNTTPMSTQTIQESQPANDYSQYYQSTTNPTVFDRYLPNAVENRANIPLTNQGITVSQDVVSTTYRPSISGDGVLEVNQNVKIYGIGRPDTTAANNGYLYNVPDNNNGLYSTTMPNGEPKNPKVYPDNFYTGVQDTSVYQRIPSENIPYDSGNKYLSTVVPGANSGIITGLYPNAGFDGIPQGDSSITKNAPILNVNNFEIPELTTRPALAVPTANENLGPGRIIGEDFSGPNQPQKFDPETGYYYK